MIGRDLARDFADKLDSRVLQGAVGKTNLK
jgi:hypothetical protein